MKENCSNTTTTRIRSENWCCWGTFESKWRCHLTNSCFHLNVEAHCCHRCWIIRNGKSIRVPIEKLKSFWILGIFWWSNWLLCCFGTPWTLLVCFSLSFHLFVLLSFCPFTFRNTEGKRTEGHVFPSLVCRITLSSVFGWQVGCGGLRVGQSGILYEKMRHHRSQNGPSLFILSNWQNKK